MSANLENSAMATGLKKISFIPIPKKSNAKECSVSHTIMLISHTSSLCSNSLQARLQQYVNWELPDVQAGFQRGRGTREQTVNSHRIMEKARELEKARQFQKTPTSVSLTMLKPLTVWITMNCGKFLKRWEGQTTLPAFWESCMQVKKQQIKLNTGRLVQNGERSTSRLYIITLLI